MKKLLIFTITILLSTFSSQAQMTPVVAPPLPSSLSFAGESVPLQNFDVRERLDREVVTNCFLHSKTLIILKLANRYEKEIRSILRKNQVPDDFFYLCVAESALQNLVSRAGAAGFWQFMPATARGYGLEVNSYVDERYNWRLSTEKACRYLKDAYNKFGSWTAAAASYNMGMGGLNSRMSQQGERKYYDLVLPEETERYVFRILAFKVIMSNPTAYGYKLNSSDLYYPLPTRTETVTYSISNLVSWAKSKGTTFRLLTELNPWLRSTFLTNNSGKQYTIYLPR